MASAYDLGLKNSSVSEYVSFKASDNTTNLLCAAKDFKYKCVALDHVAELVELTNKRNKVVKELIIPQPNSIATSNDSGCVMRITIPLSEGIFIRTINSSQVQQFDIIAVDLKEASDSLFNQSCSELNIDLLMIDVNTEKSISGKRLKSLRMAMKRGVCLEVQYAPALLNNVALKNFLGILKCVREYKLGKMLVVSSGASCTDHIRSPVAVRDMIMVSGLDKLTAMSAVSCNCKRVMDHGVARKSGVMGAIYSYVTPSEPTTNNEELGKRSLTDNEEAMGETSKKLKKNDEGDT